MTTISFFSQSTNDNIRNFGNLEFVIECNRTGRVRDYIFVDAEIGTSFLPETVNKGGAEK